MHDLPYRPCVGIALFNPDGLVFVGERIDTPGAWQMPQGGADPGETTEQTALRELGEEVGISPDHVHILEIHGQKLTYDFPPHLQSTLLGGCFRGQEQTWVAARFSGRDSDIDLNAYDPAEFSRWQWMALERVPDLIVPFKREIYRAVIEAFSRFAEKSV